jgi:hypothetical protein
MSMGKIAGALALAGLLAACGLIHDIRSEGVSERCAEMVSAAWPGSVAITDSRASVADRVETAEVSGTANGTQLKAQCRFERDVLTDFRWLSGPFAAASGSPGPPSEGGGHQ